MCIYRELDPLEEYRTQRGFKSNREHKTRVNIPNLAYCNQLTDIKTLSSSREHVTVPDTVKITFNLEIDLKHNRQKT